MAKALWYPPATKRELPQAKTQAKISPRSVVLHTAVSTGRSLYNYFNGRSNGVESHLYLRLDGTWEQYMPFNRRADCQRDGNPYAISIESQDNGASDPDDIIPWTTAQINAIVAFLVWVNREWGIPIKKCAAYNGAGIGWHALFTSDHFPRWNANHACPARKRIAQFPGILSKAQAAARGDEGDDDMPTAKEVAKAVWEYPLNPGEFAERIGLYGDPKNHKESTPYPAGGLQVGGDAYGRELHREVVPRVEAIEAKVNHLDAQQDARHKELYGLLSAQGNLIRALAEKVDALTNQENQ